MGGERPVEPAAVGYADLGLERAEVGAEPDAAPTRRRRVGMRWKLLVAFATAFTLVFVFIAVWVFRNTTADAQERLVSQLHSTAIGGAETLDVDRFLALVATVPPVADPANRTGYGFPDDALYRDSVAELERISTISSEAYPYTYFRDPADGQLYYLASSGAFTHPDLAAPFKVPIADLVSEQTLRAMTQGLERTTDEPLESDEFGTWLSTYTPIRDATGTVVGGMGVDYMAEYLHTVENEVQRELYPVLLVTYLVLLGLVFVVSGAVVRPLRRLTAATARVAEGEYDLDLAPVTRTRFPDEMAELASSFAVMATKVAGRERALVREVQRLRIEIDHVGKEQAVAEIVESDFFTDLAAKAEDMRRLLGGEL